MAETILIVDDDHKLVDLVRQYLEREGYRVLEAYDGRQALEMARRQHPDLMILDLMLPTLDGLDVCRMLRAESNLPIIMLTARVTEDDRLLGLGMGADAYITKPFDLSDLVWRIRDVLRRAAERESGPSYISYRDLEVDFARRQVTVAGRAVHLTDSEFSLLEALIRQPGRVFSRQELLEKIFGEADGGMERAVDVHIMKLRKKIEPDPNAPRYIETVYAAGYCLKKE